MHDKHQWMSYTLLDMIAFCEQNGMAWQREILLDTVAVLGVYQGDLIAAFNEMSSVSADKRKRIAQVHAA
jgi:hypothetical protein